MMGAGKTTVGRLLAEMTGRPFFDTDAMVEERLGRSIAEVWGRQGEDAFRDLESAVVADAAARRGGVIAVGGGAVLRPGNVAALKSNGRLVWLRADPATLRARVGNGGDRPLAARLEHLAAEREPAYRDAADVIIETAGVD